MITTATVAIVPPPAFHLLKASRETQVRVRMAADFTAMVGTATSRNVRIVNDMEMRYAQRRIYAPAKSEKIRMSFEKQFGAMRLGKTALIPMWEGKSVL